MFAMADQPALLSSFLCECMQNRFSEDSLHFILERCDFLLPGECGRLWRNTLQDEVPAAKFNAREERRFRGPLLVTHRYIWGKYVSARFLRAAGGDLRIYVCPPTDGEFWRDAYEGEPIVVDLTLGDLRTFVRRVAFESTDISLPPELHRSFNLLHPYYQEALFGLLLDSLGLRYGDLSGTKAAEDRLASSGKQVPWLATAEQRVSLLTRKYNYWAAQTGGRMPQIDSSLLARAREAVRALDPTRTSAWLLRLTHNQRSANLVPVHEGFWVSQHTQSFYTPDVRAAFQRSDRRDFKGHTFFTRGSESFWRIRVFTDAEKRRLYLKMRPSVLEDYDVQTHSEKITQAEMGQEDVLARHLENEDRVSLQHGATLHQLHTLRCEVTGLPLIYPPSNLPVNFTIFYSILCSTGPWSYHSICPPTPCPPTTGG
jgi:hypothetical protein